tara:strand:+ start:614 stop:772 length:159 start_codon:yes stop_codon:yes gene_type:complete
MKFLKSERKKSELVHSLPFTKQKETTVDPLMEYNGQITQIIDLLHLLNCLLL